MTELRDDGQANHGVSPLLLLLRVLDDVSGPLSEGGPHVPLQFFYYFFIFFPCFSAFDGDTLGSFIFLTSVSLVSSTMQPGKNPIHVRVFQDFHLFPFNHDR